ncbi:hypothetical protein FOA52_009054 [Chlamydomonas sp. UWO 241]|nr:hypothetical protein FOA52_009054 [Chlamydomonas sp. UWO 241]
MEVLSGMLSSGTAKAVLPKPKEVPDYRSPVYMLILVQLVAFLLSNSLELPATASLGLNVRSPAWWQLVTSAFSFSSWSHLFESAFLTYVIGRLVERAHGAWGLWAAYLGAAIGASTATLWAAKLSSAAIPSAAASPAGLLGLVVVGLIIPRALAKPLEVAALVPFIASSAAVRCTPLAGLTVYNGAKIGAWVHMGGAAVGALAVYGVLCLIDAHTRRVAEEKAEVARWAKAKQMEEQAEAVTGVISTAANAASRVAKTLF